MKNLSLLFWSFFLSSQFLWAQIELVPYRSPEYSSNKGKTKEKGDARRGDPLNLPFFEDFSNYRGNPLPSLWLEEGGVFVNNEMSLAPISLGVATFDGVDAFGNPYDFSGVNNTAIGLSDALISCPIDLGAHQPSDSLYLSFFWQREGRGESPDNIDSLRLQFLNDQDEWQSVWSQIGTSTPNSFEQVLVPLKAEALFHAAFQFRFQAFGRQSGLYDVWHVDYIYLDEGRGFEDIFSDEIACSRPVNSFLSRYQAMPLNQFFANPTAETASSFSTTLNNLSLTGQVDAPSFRAVLREKNTDQEISELANTAAFLLIGGDRQFEIEAPIPPDLIAPSIDPLALEASFILASGDGTTQIPGVDLRRNDTIRSLTILDDYYAYDDGSAEYGIRINQERGQVAIRFELNEPDILTDVQIHITKLENDLEGETFNLVVWRHIGPPQDTILYKINVPIRYSDLRNGYLSIKEIKESSLPDFFFEPIAIEAGVFYIGWEQVTDERLPVTFGYDRNNDSSENIFFNVGNNWTNFEAADNERGSIMMRPVFGEGTLTAEEPEIKPEILSFFPNPARDRVFMNGFTESAKNWEYSLYDAQGQFIQHLDPEEGGNRPYFNLPELAEGLYFIRIQASGKRIATKRLLIQH